MYCLHLHVKLLSSCLHCYIKILYTLSVFTSGNFLGRRHLSATPVTSSNTPLLAIQPQASSSTEQRPLEYPSTSDTGKHEWGSVAKDPSLLYVRREPWDKTAVYPFSAKAFYVGTTSASSSSHCVHTLLVTSPGRLPCFVKPKCFLPEFPFTASLREPAYSCRQGALNTADIAVCCCGEVQLLHSLGNTGFQNALPVAAVSMEEQQRGRQEKGAGCTL